MYWQCFLLLHALSWLFASQPFNTRDMVLTTVASRNSSNERHEMDFAQPNNTAMIRSCRNHHHHLDNKPISSETLLIVVNYHYAYYQSISFFDNEYFPEFCRLYSYDFDVLFIGVKEDKQNRVINNGLLPKGYMSQRSVHTAWEYVGEEYSLRYSGLLFMNDDSYVDPINLNEMNLSYSYYEGNVPLQRGNNWLCWDWHYGNVSAFRYNVKGAIEEINASPELKSVCGEWKWDAMQHGKSDFFYITRDQLVLFLQFEDIFFKHYNFLEVAVYSTMKCLTTHSIRNCNHMPCRVSDYEFTHIHPLKYSKEANRRFAMTVMRRGFNRYEHYSFYVGRGREVFHKDN